MEEGIKGFYNFLTGYKRYADLIGEKNPAIACKKIQADGWATAPTYAVSLYNDYIDKYGLFVYDMEGNPAPVPEDPVTKPSYIMGRVYTLQANLYIRKVPNGIKKKMYELTVNAKLNSYSDQKGDAVLRAGTRVSCIDVVRDGNSIWLLIPSGYICAVSSGGNVFIK